MRAFGAFVLVVCLSICSPWTLTPALAQLDVVISVDVVPPPLPVYDQPPIPAPGYLWVPGYWAWDDDVGYYWVPGTWVLPPEPELLWTPGYWGWDDGYYVFHEGYWGPQIGFYGGVVYGFGYDGVGYEGGYWRNGAFFYNRTVNNISNVTITNVYNKTVIINNRTNVSFNGGAGGTTAKPTSAQLAIAQERHVAATADQTRHAQEAAKDPALSLAGNHGHPTVAATTRAAQFKGPGVVAAQPGQPVAAVPPKGHSRKVPEQKGPPGTGPTTTPPGAAPGPKGPPGAGTTTPPPGAAPGRKGPPGAGTTTPPPGAAPGPKSPPGAGTTTTTPGAATGRQTHERKGPAGGTTTGPGSAPQGQKPQSTAPHPQPAARPAPPPPPRPQASPPPRPQPPPPKPQPAKPKCQPGQKCQ